MEFRCKRYRISEVCRDDATFFVVQRRWFVLLWVRQFIPPHDYFDFPFHWLPGCGFVFYHIEDAVDGLTAWLRATHKPDDYTVYITLPTL